MYETVATLCSIVRWSYSTRNNEIDEAVGIDCYIDKETLESLKEPEAPAFIEVENDIETMLIPTEAIIEITY